MSTDARKRHRQKLRRQKKRIQMQRAQSGSPFSRVSQGGEVVACYVNRDWREAGMISMHVLRRRADGGHSMGGFLIDPWCIGLKDAYGRQDMTASEFRENVIDHLSRNMDLERVSVDLARRLVAGAVRFSHQNGFRLPHKWERWTRVLGDIGDWRTADLSEFGVGGKLRYVGDIDDLRRRLVGSKLEQFLDRGDVEFLMGPSGMDFNASDEPEDIEWELDEEDEDNADPDDFDEELVDEGIATVQDRALERVRRWCFANQVVPSPRLPEVIEHTLHNAGVVLIESKGADEPQEAGVVEGQRSLEELMSRQRGQDAIDFSRAIEQMQGYMRQFATAEAFIEALGLATTEEE